MQKHIVFMSLIAFVSVGTVYGMDNNTNEESINLTMAKHEVSKLFDLAQLKMVSDSVLAGRELPKEVTEVCPKAVAELHDLIKSNDGPIDDGNFQLKVQRQIVNVLLAWGGLASDAAIARNYPLTTAEIVQLRVYRKKCATEAYNSFASKLRNNSAKPEKSNNNSKPEFEEKKTGNNNPVEDQQPLSEAFHEADGVIKDTFSLVTIEAARNEMTENGFNADDRANYPAETAAIMALANQLNNPMFPDDQRARVQCQLNQRVVDFIAKAQNQATLERGFPLVPAEELPKLKQKYAEHLALLQQEVDNAAAQLGLPKLHDSKKKKRAPKTPNKTPNLPLPQDPTFVEKTKTFMSNHKLMIGGVAAAVVLAIWYVRTHAEELDVKGRVKAVKNYVQTKLGLNEEVSHA